MYKTHGVGYKSLQNWVNGGHTLSEFNALKRKLTHSEESVFVDFIIQSADLALPLSVKNIRTHADEILKGRNTPGEAVGVQWVGRFLNHYCDQLQTHWSSPLATECAKCLNPEAVKCWFALGLPLSRKGLSMQGSSRKTFIEWMRVGSHLQTKEHNVLWGDEDWKFSIKLGAAIGKMSQHLLLSVLMRLPSIQP